MEEYTSANNNCNSERRGIEIAVLFEVVTQIPAHYWINHQQAFDTTSG
jgi:hypothetical protein